MKRIHSLLLTILCTIALNACDSSQQAMDIRIVPKPVSTVVHDGQFTLTPKTVINVAGDAESLTPACTFFNNLISASFGAPLKVEQQDAQQDAINVSVDPTMKSEAYNLNVNKKGISIQGGSPQAVFYAFQTLRQMLPVSIEKGEPMTSVAVRNVEIQDEPRFRHRGIMLDCCRHFFTVDEVKTFIDMLALHKIDRFHWHLTDDQGWRIEIKKYPNLTQIGGQRTETVIGRNSGKYDGQPYGGFYTQEDIKEVVKYAADRYITIIPEVELPGHAGAALAAYPEIGCTGGPYEVVKEWGVFDDVYCAGNEKTFELLQDVLDEMIPLFPSEYFHIGGDECPKKAWKNCPKCQARIKTEKLKDEFELQSYFVHRMEKHLNGKGKKIIGWDEILEGGLSKTATVMAWRGTKYGIEAAKMGNDVIMVPNTYAYLDYYQSREREKEPLAIGGFVDVAKVYSLNPTEGLTQEEAPRIIGVQGNMWTEYIPTFSHLQYMYLPRMAAIAEVGWTPNEQKDYQDFVNRAAALTERYEALGYNYAKHILSVYGKAEVNEKDKCIELTLLPKSGDTEIHYTLDGSTPTLASPLYTSPIAFKTDTEVKAQLFRGGKPVGNEYFDNFKISRAAFKDIRLLTQTSSGYSGNGARTLADGQRGSSDYQDGKWLASQSDDISAILDFGEETEYKQIGIGIIQEKGSWIYAPKSIIVYASNDGNDFQEIAKLADIARMEGMDKNGLHTITLPVENGKSRYIKVFAEREKFLPEGHESAGKPAFIFMDEIEVY